MARGMSRTRVQSSPGNEVRYSYDGLNRLVLTTRVLTSDGTGATSPTDDIVTGQAWDDSSRLITQTDDNGNVTTYTYDALDRLVTTTVADQTTTTSTYDTHDNRLTMTDGNGTVATWTYDLLDRRTTTSVNRASGIVGTTWGSTRCRIRPRSRSAGTRHRLAPTLRARP